MGRGTPRCRSLLMLWVQFWLPTQHINMLGPQHGSVEQDLLLLFLCPADPCCCTARANSPLLIMWM